MGEEWDYIIIGAGSAGCVMAARLSENPRNRVLLLEAGPRDSSLMLRIPAGTSRVFRPGKYNWGYMTDPLSTMAGRRMYWPRGKTLGGSSAINGMVYMRGHPDDYALWVQQGATGWGWDDVLPWFKKAEDQERGESESYGVGGPLAVQDLRVSDPAGRLYIEAGVAAGLCASDDFNSGVQDGIGRPQATIRDGVRCSTAAGYLRPAEKRANLKVKTGALVLKIATEGKHVTGVAYLKDGRTISACANRAVICCGGAVNSPQLLMLSGIGPADGIKAVGLDVVHDLPGVGQNLQDHVYAYCIAEAKEPGLSANRDLVGLGAVRQALKYLMGKRGWLNLGACQAAAFVRIMPDADRPDVQMSFRPLSAEVSETGDMVIHDFPGLTASCGLLRPESTGEIKLRSADPRDTPAILPNYLATERDQQTFLGGYRFNRKLFATSPLKEHVAREYWPGPDINSDEQTLAFLREHAESMYHAAGTCRMGSPANRMAVVDSKCRVIGMEGLYVVDASVMPTITSANTNGPTVMIAEKAASHM